MNKQAQESKSVETNKCLKKEYPWGDVNELHFSYLETEGIVLADSWGSCSHVRVLRLGDINQSQWREGLWDQ